MAGGLTRRQLLAASGAAALLGCTARSAPPVDPGVSPFEPAPRPLSADFRRGMNFAHLHRRGYGYGSARAEVQLRRLAQLGVTDIALNPFAYTRSLSSPSR